MSYLDPTAVRISENTLLSDFMGCSSVYGRGFCNKFESNWTEKLAEGRFLGSHLDEIQAILGPFSICYGFISPTLSRKIVTYQSPDKPSFHRWDLGAAADICLHEALYKAPIFAAKTIDSELSYSRMITYSESEWICFGTKWSEKDTGLAEKLYENRYIGPGKPDFIRYSDNRASRAKQLDLLVLRHPWRGQGWPSYHGGGRRQYEHHRVSDYSVITDFLYDKHLVHDGVPNPPPLHCDEGAHNWARCARLAGAVIDKIASDFKTRVSVIKAYNSTKPAQNWSRRFTLEFVVPEGQDAYDIAEAVNHVPGVARIQVIGKRGDRIAVVGEDL